MLQNKELLIRALLNANLSEPFNTLGYVETEYASHRFRIGTATAAAATNISPWLIKTLGRWRSDCYQLCIRTPRTIIHSDSEKLAAVPINNHVHY